MATKKQNVHLKSEVKSKFTPDKITAGVAPVIPENTEDRNFVTQEILHGRENGRLIPENRHIVPKKPRQSFLLEDYHHVNLKEYEEGEAEAGDLEWTRYADKKDPQLPESKIDLDSIPNTANGLRDILVELQKAEIHNLQGETNLKKNLVKKALRDFNHALEINPNYVDALVNRGHAYVIQKQYDDALKDFNLAIDLDSKRAEIYNVRGEIYFLNRSYTMAIKDFTTAINLNPMYSDAYLNRAIAYNEKGIKQEAKSDFIQAIRTDSKVSTYVDLTDLEALFDE